MKIATRSLVVLLLLVFLAPSLQAQPSAPSQPASQPAADLLFATEQSTCLGQESSSFSIPTEQAPPALPMGPVFPQQRCGACSTGGCAGAVWNSRCGGGITSPYRYCVDIATCPADGLFQCDCRQPQ